jgi:POT family proton-dependent oligopeptide transporter
MMGIWFLAIATGNKLAGTMSGLYPEEQKIEATYKLKDVTVGGTNVDWNGLQYSKAVNNTNAWKPVLIKKNDKSKEPDSLVAIEVVSNPSGYAYDSAKTKRIIPGKMDKDELAQLPPGDKEPKFVYALSEDPKYTYLLVNDLKGKEKSVVLQKWVMQPARPKFLGIVIKDLYTYFMIFVGFSGVASILLFLLCRKLQKMMHGVS